MKKWRVYRQSSNETVLWWPYHEGSPTTPAGMLFDALYTIYGFMDRAVWTLQNALNQDPGTFTVEMTKDFIRFGEDTYVWELEEDLDIRISGGGSRGDDPGMDYVRMTREDSEKLHRYLDRGRV